MTHSASLENCKMLYDMSGWFNTSCKYSENGEVVAWKPFTSVKHVPAYDLGYLLRKLPKVVITKDDEMLPYVAKYDLHRFEDITPEDAACLLAIKLWEEGVMTR